jgi:predicted SAM-dependent methyltransferase
MNSGEHLTTSNFFIGLIRAVRSYRARYLDERRNQKVNQKLIHQALKQEEIKLELGSHVPRPGWYTVDLLPGADLVFDLTQKFPFPDNSVDRIYCSHVFEHFTYKDLVKIISECHRILKKGGSLSVCVPDAELYLKMYADPLAFKREQYIVEGFTEYRNENKIDIVNFVAYLYGNHKHMFDREGLIFNLKQGGFAHASTREFDPALDKQERDYQSIYAIAIK